MKESGEHLFFELENLTPFTRNAGDSSGSVHYKNINLKRTIIGHFANKGNATIAELSRMLNISTPKVTEIVGELINGDLVKDYGKSESNGGRRPNQYGLVPDSVFFIGVEVKDFYINIGLLDFKKRLLKTALQIDFTLSNTEESLNDLCSIIRRFISTLTVRVERIWGIGVILSGRINYKSGYSYSYFQFNEDPLSKVLESRLGIRTFLENDSRAIAYGEFCQGIVKEEKNVLFINMDYGIGLGIMIDGELHYGKSGFAGEFGHIPLFNNEIICHCGKKGCLETVASGRALLKMFREKTLEGASSVLNRKNTDVAGIKIEDIIRAANNDDVLAIELLAEIGENMGRGIAVLVNIFNPELIILGGALASTGDFIRLPIKSSINKYSLSLVNNDTQLKLSTLGNLSGITGACLLVRNMLLNF